MSFDDFKDGLQAWLDNAKDYFSDLSNEEKYGWVAECAGVVLFIAGIVLLIV